MCLWIKKSQSLERSQTAGNGQSETMWPKTRDKEQQGDAKDGDDQLNDIQRNIEKILAMLVSAEHKVKSVEAKGESLDKKIESIVTDVHNQGVWIDSQETRISALEKQIGHLEDQLDALENRMRRNNIQILNSPEGQSGQSDIQ